mgnify:CR=1 FL=1
MISTRGRYAIRLLADLAEHNSGAYIPLKEIADRQEISQKYIEKFIPTLTKAGLIEGQHGKGGGYRLTRAPEKYTILEILRLTEVDLAPVACLAENAEPCARAAECRTLPMWKRYNELTEQFFAGVTLADLLHESGGNEYVI